MTYGNIFDSEPEAWVVHSPLFQKSARRPLIPPNRMFTGEGLGFRRTDGLGLRKAPVGLTDIAESGRSQSSPSGGQGPGRRRPISAGTSLKKQMHRSASTPSSGFAGGSPGASANVRLDPLPAAQQHAAERLPSREGWPSTDPRNGSKHRLQHQASKKHGDSKDRSKKAKHHLQDQMPFPWDPQPVENEGDIVVEDVAPEPEEQCKALREITSVASQIAEAMTAMNTTLGLVGDDEPADNSAECTALKEIAAASSRVCGELHVDDSLDDKKIKAPYDDPVLMRARKLASLTYELIEDIQLAQGDVETIPVQQAHEYEVASLQGIAAVTRQVQEDMQQLQQESWAIAALAEITADEESPEGEEGDAAEQAGAEENPAIDAAYEAFVVSCQDPEITQLILRAHSRATGSDDSLSDEEVADLRTAFLKFKVPDSEDVHKDNLGDILGFLGRWAPPKDVMVKIGLEVSMYDYMDFDEFLGFMTRYSVIEKAEQQRVFRLYDEDGSGNIDVSELRNLVIALGLTPFRQMMQEALTLVDKNWNAELDFNELVCFIAVYRFREGFTKDQADTLRKEFEAVATEHPGNPGEPFYVLPGTELATLLVQVFGLQVEAVTDKLQAEIAASAGFKPTDPDEATGITFREFLIYCRRAREMQMEVFGQETGMGGSDSSDFAAADKDKSGRLSVAELFEFLRGQEYTPLKKVINEILEDVASETVNAEEPLDFNQFFDFMFVYRSRDGFEEHQVEFYRKIFKSFDDDGSGSISTLELSDIFRELGYRMSVEALKIFIDKVDSDGSNLLDFREFLRLMRLFRESELGKMKSAFRADSNDGTEDGLVDFPKIKGCLAALDYREPTSITKRLKEVDLTEVPFENFVDLVDKCRHDQVEREKRMAGFTNEEIEKYQNQFNEYDKDRGGFIDPKELQALLKAFNWEPKNKQEREALIGKINMARRAAKEAGVEDTTEEDGAEVSFWEFIQLVRQLKIAEEQEKEARINAVIEETGFAVKETNQFRVIFTRWYYQDDESKDPDEEGNDLVDDYSGISRDLAKRIVRSLGISLSGDKSKQLDTVLDKFEENGLLYFFGFLRLMKWIVDTNFAGTNDA
eukprot:TRINITY_DN94306_c0_g1_i1.p1 TRINITY_DN94306_c0_g1~~TRINITY_DN94306_c0_g1_i1.p1  ORF type:complete len:1130 (+),score=267.36 TRINITY_DN94306_c0_g1_i1:103-3390(+)